MTGTPPLTPLPGLRKTQDAETWLATNMTLSSYVSDEDKERFNNAKENNPVALRLACQRVKQSCADGQYMPITTDQLEQILERCSAQERGAVR